MESKNKIFKEMKALAKKMDSEVVGSTRYNTLSVRYKVLAGKIGAVLPDPVFIRTIKPCSCKSVEISINTEKGRCYFKCTNCGIHTPKCANKEDARDYWNNLVKQT